MRTPQIRRRTNNHVELLPGDIPLVVTRRRPGLAVYRLCMVPFGSEWPFISDPKRIRSRYLKC